MSDHQAPFFTQLGILTKRLLLRVVRRPLSELPNLIISAFFLFIYDGALGRVFGASAVGTSLDFAQGNFVNFILPVSIVSASLSGSASGFYIIEDIESGVFKRYQGMPISKWSIILAPMVIGPFLKKIYSNPIKSFPNILLIFLFKVLIFFSL